MVSTYAYVNPVVAVFLGWTLAGEPFTLNNAVVAVLILTSVVIISRNNSRSTEVSIIRSRSAHTLD